MSTIGRYVPLRGNSRATSSYVAISSRSKSSESAKEYIIVTVFVPSVEHGPLTGFRSAHTMGGASAGQYGASQAVCPVQPGPASDGTPHVRRRDVMEWVGEPGSVVLCFRSVQAFTRV